VVDALIIFGGYSRLAGFQLQDNRIFTSYFADTFVCQMKPNASTKDSPSTDSLSGAHMNWKQVLTGGFPTYRACPQFVEDTGTGKIYLFSGFFEREFLPHGMPTDKHVKCFVDLWELRLAMPGGNFEGVDIEEEARTAKTGPWKRCFTCCAVGYLHYKCAGVFHLIDFQDGSD